jgi:hypothetical protein
MKKTSTFLIILIYLFGTYACQSQGDSNSTVPRLDVSELEYVGEVDERYQSVNVEMCEVVGGDFWVPYHLIDTARVRKEGFAALKRKIPAIDLYNQKLRNLASALGPMYIRVSGTWANTTYFQDNDEPKLDKAPEGYENVLTRKEWKGVIDFCKTIDAKLVTSFAISDGIRDADGNWTTAQIEPLINYTKSVGGEITAAEMFNEPSHASHGSAPEGYDAAWYARDFAQFKAYVDEAIPEMKIMGTGSTGEGGILPVEASTSTEAIITAEPQPKFDIVSYHFYGGVSQRCRGQLSPDSALSQEWLSKTEQGLQYYEQIRDQYFPEAPIWLTETAEAACGGNPWAATYVDVFRYLEQLGRLAKKGVQVVMHNTLNASEYALLDQATHDPRPNYWAAFLWSRFMGTKVYAADALASGVDVFVHNNKNTSNGKAVLIINTNDTDFSFSSPEKGEQYLLTADEMLSKTVKLNGEVLTLNADDTIPDVKGKTVEAGTVQLPPHSIMFLLLEDG